MAIETGSTVTLDRVTGELAGFGVRESRRTIAGLRGYFHDETARGAMDQGRLAYRVTSWEPVAEGQPGAVCLATTFLEPGVVGDEYFLTRGHFHAREDRPELEVTLAGSGLLMLMDRTGHTWTEPMAPGSVHHVPLATAHRVINTSDRALVFISYWASETGHDYQTIVDHGFRSRVFRRDGAPTIVAVDA